MRWHAAVNEEPGTLDRTIRLTRQAGDDQHHEVAVAVDPGGWVVLDRQPAAVAIPPLLRLPIEAIEALRDAINGYAPPRDDTDLREALTIERARVDRILDALPIRTERP